MRHALFLFLFVLTLGLGAQSTLHVDIGGGAAFTSIQTAVDAAASGDTILVQPGTYDERITLADKSLVVRSAQGAAMTFILPTTSGTAVAITGSNATVVLEGFTITGNGGTGGGVFTEPGGVLLDGGVTARLRACIIENCTGSSSSTTSPFGGTGGAGGLWVTGGAHGILENCLVTNNQGGSGMLAGGAGGLDVAGPCEIIGSVITGNTGGSQTPGALSGLGGGVGGIRYSAPFSLTLSNSILRDNHGGFSSAGVQAFAEFAIFGFLNSVNITIDHSNVQGGLDPTIVVGAGVIDANPLFVNPMLGDYTLQPGSPCIDAGGCGAIDPLGRDLGGDPRLRGFAPDMGAFEFQHDTTRQGTSEDILLTTVVNGNQADALTNTKTVGGGDNLVVHWESPCGSLVGAPYFLVGQFFTAGMPPLPFTPTIYLDTMGAAIIQGPAFMLPGGEDLIVSVPPGSFAPAVVRVQLLVITPLSQAPFGIASSDAQDLVLQ